jgi:hypothetical protein
VAFLFGAERQHFVFVIFIEWRSSACEVFE